MLNQKKYPHSALIKKLLHSITIFAHLQLFITICSLPILSIWGLRFSVLSPLGNLIFGPYMTGYLCIAFFLFISEIFLIPNFILLGCIEKYSDIWLWILSWSNSKCIIALPHHGLVFYSIACMSTILIHFSKIKSIAARIAIYAILLITCLSYAYFSSNKLSNPITIPHGTDSIILKEINQQKILCCFNTLAQAGSENFIRYTVYSKLNTLGITSIPFVISSNSSTGTYRALTALINCVTVKHLFIIKPHKKHTKISLHWHALLEKAAYLGIKIHLLPQDILIDLEHLFMKY